MKSRDRSPGKDEDDTPIRYFYDVSGTYKGTYSVKMSSNQTVLLPMNGDIAKYISDFEGSVMIQPRDVIVQLQLMHQSGNSLGSTGNWLSAK